MRQRVVGALVLGCLAIILIPLLLDGEGIVTPPLATKIPTAPTLDNSPIAEPTRPVITADSLPTAQDETTANATQSAETVGNSAAVVKPTTVFTPAPAYEPDAAKPKVANSATNSPDALEAAVAAIMAKSKSAASKTQAPAQESVPHKDAAGLPESFTVRLASFGEKANADSLLKNLLSANYKAYSRPINTANGLFYAVYAGPTLTRAEAKELASKVDATFKVQSVIETFTVPNLQ